MGSLSDSMRNLFLAGIDVAEATAEKGKEVAELVAAKGSVAADRGKEMNSELKHKTEAVAEEMRGDFLEIMMKTMSAEERAQFVEKANAIAAEADAADAAKTAEAVDVDAEIVGEAEAEEASEEATPEAVAPAADAE